MASSDEKEVPDERRREELRSIGAAARWLIVAFALVRVLDAAGVPVDPLGTAVIALAGLMILAHVAATVIGTSRRDATDAAPVSRSSLGATIPVTRSVLHADMPFSRRLIFWVVVGALAAAGVAAAWTLRMWPRIGIGGAAIIELSAGTMGAYVGFMVGRLTLTARTAFRQAADAVRSADLGVTSPRDI